jgi:hypothetical protein
MQDHSQALKWEQRKTTADGENTYIVHGTQGREGAFRMSEIRQMLTITYITWQG